ncbi:MAG TPA: alkaline phosphatase D family protein [Roseimicrobium sp.]|nr:alkaline phosphatase D family protein [Roseimicrobium sp.]
MKLPSPRVVSLAVFAIAGVLTFTACSKSRSGVSPVGWAWTGGVTEKSAIITGRIAVKEPVSLLIVEKSVTVTPTLTAAMEDGMLHRFTLTDLKPGTLYHYRFVSSSGASLDDETRSFSTFPVPGKPASFRFAVASCSKPVNSPTFTAAAHQGVSFFLHTGDFHYNNIAKNRVEVFRSAYDSHLSAPSLRAFLATTPLFYQWDDHDFGPSGSDKTSPSRTASIQNYKELVPHFAISNPSDPLAPVDQAFTVGRVRFILSDLRSQRDRAGHRMMNAAQDAWLREQLLAARDAGYPLIFWMTTTPWNGAPADFDRWQGYTAQRTEIADFIKANGLVGKVAILSGDAHMTAIDDGTNSDFATGGGAPIRVFQAGPIYNSGSYKGGPYSHGSSYQGKSDKRFTHFGLVDIKDDGKKIHVTWSGREGSDGLGDNVLISAQDAQGPIQYEFTVE